MAANATGVDTTYNLTTGVKLDIEDMIWLQSPSDVPLLGQNGADGRSILSTGTCFEKKVSWLEEALLTPQTSLAATCVTADTNLLVTTGDGVKFQAGDVIKLESEYVRVTAASATTADTYVVTRGYASSTAASHNQNKDMIGLGTATKEGADAEPARWVDRSQKDNYTQIFGPYRVEVSGSEMAVQKYGIATNEFDHQLALRTREAWIAQERAVLYGQQVEDTTNGWRTMGGLDYYITTNVDSSTTTLTESTLLTQLQKIYDAGGDSDRIVVGSKQKKLIAGFATPTGAGGSGTTTFLQRDDRGRGIVVDTYMSDFGTQTVVLDRWCLTNNLFVFPRDNVTILTLRPLQFEMLGRTGDATKGFIVAEKTARIRKQLHAAKFTALT